MIRDKILKLLLFSICFAALGINFVCAVRPSARICREGTSYYKARISKSTRKTLLKLKKSYTSQFERKSNKQSFVPSKDGAKMIEFLFKRAGGLLIEYMNALQGTAEKETKLIQREAFIILFRDSLENAVGHIITPGMISSVHFERDASGKIFGNFVIKGDINTYRLAL